MKIAINKQFGGFRLSHKAMMRIFELKGIKVYPYFSEGDHFIKAPVDYKQTGFGLLYYLKKDLGDSVEDDALDYDLVIDDSDLFGDNYYETKKDRIDIHLIQAIEELGKEANTVVSNLKIVEIPNGYKFSIHDYDGLETLTAASDILEF